MRMDYPITRMSASIRYVILGANRKASNGLFSAAMMPVANRIKQLASHLKRTPACNDTNHGIHLL